VSSLTAIFGNTEDKEQDSDKLLNLYWNRAELKKEFAGMRKEQFKLQDRIKQHEGATARLQQKLDHLEDLLVDPVWVHNVVVFYQLRSLGARCERKLAKFAEQLKQQREQKQHNNVLVKWNDARTQDAREIEQRILLKRDSVQQLEDQLQVERQRLMNMSGFLKIFRRRSVTAMLDDLAQKTDRLRQEELELTASLEEIRNRKPPDNAGLDIPTKRSINLMILSFAQQLYVQFADDELVVLVRESREKSVGAVNYGSRHECGQLLDRIQKGAEVMDQAADFADVLRNRAKLLSQKVEFQGSGEAVPLTGSTGTLYYIDSNGVVRESDVNMLAENYWAINGAFSR
jgi:hypothetical protein